MIKEQYIHKNITTTKKKYNETLCGCKHNYYLCALKQ